MWYPTGIDSKNELPYSGQSYFRLKVVSKAEVKAELERKDSNVPILLIIPLRLGLDQVNTVYINSIRYFLKSKECVGIMGGKPNQVITNPKRPQRQYIISSGALFCWFTRYRGFYVVIILGSPYNAVF